MLISELLENLNIPDDYCDILAEDWDKTQHFLAEKLPVLDKNEYMRCFKLSDCKDDLENVLDKVANAISNSSALSALFTHAHRKVAFYENTQFNNWPQTIPMLGEDSGIFYFLVGLSLIDIWTEKYKKLGIPVQYAYDCATWLGGTIQTYKAANSGVPGLDKTQLYWMRHYVDCDIFRCGRFEYMNQETQSWLPYVYERKTDGLKIALFQSGIKLDSQGKCLFADQKDDEATLITELVETPDYIEGTPVNPAGDALPDTKVRLKLDDWECILGKGDFAPGVHIPVGGGMSPERCQESFRKAIEFYNTYFPDKNIKAFVCFSWIFSPDYEVLLPESNLAKFMRELYLFPKESYGTDGMFFIFGRAPENHNELPRDNSVRRAMLSLLDEGKRLRSGGMLFLTKDIEQFGTQYYRRQFEIPENIVI